MCSPLPEVELDTGLPVLLFWCTGGESNTVKVMGSYRNIIYQVLYYPVVPVVVKLAHISVCPVPQVQLVSGLGRIMLCGQPLPQTFPVG